jgi:hypothetical protein
MGFDIACPSRVHFTSRHGAHRFARSRRYAVPARGRQRKDDVAGWYRARFQTAEGLVFVGIAQEKARSFKARKATQSGHVLFDFSRQSVAVKHVYFYVQDLEWGPASSRWARICRTRCASA